MNVIGHLGIIPWVNDSATWRVEFTMMTERGQDKGHAIVPGDLDADFLLPMDTKPEMKDG